MNMNKVFYGGHLTRDPALKYTPGQVAIVEFGVAASRKWKDQSGQLKEDVCFVDCTMFGKRAETINQYFKKGSPILVEARLSLDQWTTQDGQKRSKLKVIVEDFHFIGGKKEGANPDPGHYDNQNPRGNDDTDIPF